MTTTAAARSGPEPVLVGTKLHAPAVRPDFVPRRELVRRLIAAHAAKLVLVSAPAGWGKTMLLSEWQASHAEDRAFLGSLSTRATTTQFGFGVT